MTTTSVQRTTLAILVLAISLRVVALWLWSEDLSIDRDAYLGIAESIWQGRGFSSPGSVTPTAFRPPLYPLLLSSFLWLGVPAAVASVNLLMTTLLVFATSRLARQLGLNRWDWLPALFVAVDPLLIKYTTQPMTEVTSAALLVSWVSAWLSWHSQPSWRWAILTGILFGLNVLTRPTLLAAVPFLALWTLWHAWSLHRAAPRLAIVATLACSLMLAAWSLRNAALLGTLTPATTHGGYTLLLANNDAFFSASVSGGHFGQSWERLPSDHPDSQSAWYARLNSQMQSLGLTSEAARDRFQYEQAWATIRAQPATFLKACALRFYWFWHIVPQGPEAPSLSRLVYYAIASFYLLENVLALAGLVRLTRARPFVASILAIPIVTLSLVHLIFWTNLRMRAPLLPLLAILASIPLTRLRLFDKPCVAK